MKKSPGILAVITVFVVAAIILLLLSPFSKNQGLVLLDPEQSEKVEQIIISSVKDSIIFKKQSAEWVFGDEVLNQQAVENVLIAGTRLVKTSVVPLADLPPITSSLDLSFQSSKKELCRLQILNTEGGTFVLTDEGDPATGVELPGFEDHKLEKIFSGELNHYRMHLLLDLLPKEVRSIRVLPFEGSGFIAEQDETFNLKIRSLDEDDDYTDRVDERKIRLLFTYCSGIRYAAVIADDVLKQQVFEKKADAEIEVLDIEGRATHFELYNWIKEGRPNADLFELLLVVNNGEEVLRINYYFLELMLRSLENYMLDGQN